MSNELMLNCYLDFTKQNKIEVVWFKKVPSIWKENKHATTTSLYVFARIAV